MTALTGTGTLLRAASRQDARNIAPWVMLITVLSASSILIYLWIFPDNQSRSELAATISTNPALWFIFGPARDLMTADGFNAWRAGALGAFFAGLMTILIVVRNSRADEDSGQAEMIASGVIARHSRLLVAVLMAAIASLALGVVCFVVTVACGGGLLATLMLSASLAASGILFAGLAAVTAQLGSDARTANSLAIGVLGVCYVLRGYIDSSDVSSWVVWLTPLGWLEEVRPASENNPWPLLLAVGVGILLLALALGLQQHRDFGFGSITPGPGPAEGGRLANVWGLALQLHRGALITWMISFAFLGFTFGNVASAIGTVIQENPAVGAIIAAGGANATEITFAFLAMTLQIIGIVAAVFGVQVVLRIHTEEIAYRIEPLLGGAVRRWKYLASNVLVAVLGTAAAMLIAGTFLGFVAAPKEPGISWGDVIKQAAVTIPAVWVLVGLALAAVGAQPGKRLVGWLGVVATFGLTLLGPTFKLPDWALGISPLHHVPLVIATSPDWGGLLGVSAVGVLFFVIGFVGFRRRDVG